MMFYINIHKKTFISNRIKFLICILIIIINYYHKNYKDLYKFLIYNNKRYKIYILLNYLF